MSTAPTFDTLSYARKLKAAGVDDKLANAHAEALHEALNQTVATKADISDLKAGIAKFKLDILQAVYGVGIVLATLTIAGLAALFTALKLFP